MLSKKIIVVSFGLVFLLASTVPAVMAEQYDIKTMTPEVHKALQNRHARYAEIQQRKESGLIGENNQGLLQALKDPSATAGLIGAENADRQLIYNEIVQQNNLSPSNLPQVQAVFAEVQREKAKTGEAIQLPSGEWTKK